MKTLEVCVEGEWAAVDGGTPIPLEDFLSLAKGLVAIGKSRGQWLST